MCKYIVVTRVVGRPTQEIARLLVVQSRRDRGPPRRQKQEMNFSLLLFLIGVTIVTCDISNNEIGTNDDDLEDDTTSNKTISQIFDQAVQSYLENDWDGCINGFNEALHRYKVYKRMVVNCRRKCRAKASTSVPIFSEDIDDLHFYEKKVQETLCLLSCNQDYREVAGSVALKRLTAEVERKILDRRVYEYLHICYYQKNRFQDAANAVFTFLVQNPGHQMSVENLKHYLSLPEVHEEKVLNIEASPFVKFYVHGAAAYDEEIYSEAVEYMENSLRAYLEAEEECRIYCEGPFDQGWHPEFTSSLANHFVYCLKCKRGCSLTLNNVNGEYRKDLLPSHYNYLQFAYYKLGNIKAACAAVESYLLFIPSDETMLHNKEYYSSLPEVDENYFLPRKEAVDYVKRHEYELKLLRYISDEFKTIDSRFDELMKKKKGKTKVTPEDDLPKEYIAMNATRVSVGLPLGLESVVHNLVLDQETEDNPLRKGQAYVLSKSEKIQRSVSHEETRNSKQFLDGSFANSTVCDLPRQSLHIRMKNVESLDRNIEITARENELGGRHRYVADGFLNFDQCQSLLQLAEALAVEGDGYDNNKSPHSSYERFEGLTVGRTALIVYWGLLKAEFLELLLNCTEMARRHVESYFGLDRPLYFSYTHLVCRTALPDSPLIREDLSHEIHADNCLLRGDGGCLRESPAYTWRDHSAILYLNDDFSGGEFFFADGPRRIERLVQPSCGRMVAFTAGEENLHGVRAVQQGKRCALALWFTQEENYLEYERVLAQAILQRVRLFGPLHQDAVDIPFTYDRQLYEYFDEDEILRQLLTNLA